MFKRSPLLACVLVAAVALGGCAGARTNEPPAAGTGAAAPATAPPAQAGPASRGTHYAVVASQSRATYSVREKFANRELPSDAVGSTSSFDGELVLEGGAFQPARITVDLRTLKSDSQKRDNKIRTLGLESEKYPLAEFTITGMEGLKALPADGQEAAFKLNGTMKIHGTERPFTFDARGSLKGETVVVNANAQFSMKEFNIEPPSLVGILKVEDQVKLSILVTAKPS